MCDTKAHTHEPPKRDPNQKVSCDKPSLLLEELQYPFLSLQLHLPAQAGVWVRPNGHAAIWKVSRWASEQSECLSHYLWKWFVHHLILLQLTLSHLVHDSAVICQLHKFLSLQLLSRWGSVVYKTGWQRFIQLVFFCNS